MRLIHRLLLPTVVICTQCQPNISVEHEQSGTKSEADTMAITSFNIQRKNSLRPTDWKVYETGTEIIVAPSSWISYLKGLDLVIAPPSSSDSSERIVFNRFAKDSPTLDYDKLAQQLVRKAFTTFRINSSDSLKKAELAHNFFYERTANLTKHSSAYKGYCLVYVDDKFIYSFNITITQSRLDASKGKLINDVIGNLQINHQYIIGNHNPIKKLVFLKP